MARTKLNQRAASRVDVTLGATGGRNPPSKLTVFLLIGCALGAGSVVRRMAFAETLARAEKSHAGRFTQGLDALS